MTRPADIVFAAKRIGERLAQGENIDTARMHVYWELRRMGFPPEDANIIVVHLEQETDQ
jgi:hypothetical protein